MISCFRLAAGLAVFIACAASYGCSTGRSRVWLDEKVSFSAYKALEIQPVFDATEERNAQDVSTALNGLLKARFENEGLLAADDSNSDESVLIVKSDIRIYEACRIIKYGSAGTGLSTPGPAVNTGSGPINSSTCSVRTQLLDKSTNKLVAEIFTTKKVGACFTDQYKSDRLMKAVALDIADQVVTIMAIKKSD